MYSSSWCLSSLTSDTHLENIKREPINAYNANNLSVWPIGFQSRHKYFTADVCWNALLYLCSYFQSLELSWKCGGSCCPLCEQSCEQNEQAAPCLMFGSALRLFLNFYSKWLGLCYLECLLPLNGNAIQTEPTKPWRAGRLANRPIVQGE